jgi:hypothetical protein
VASILVFSSVETPIYPGFLYSGQWWYLAVEDTSVTGPLAHWKFLVNNFIHLIVIDINYHLRRKWRLCDRLIDVCA